MPGTPSDAENQTRDRFAARVLGIFVLVLGTLLVLALPLPELGIDRLLTALAAAVLLSVGAFLLALSRGKPGSKSP